MFGSKFYVAKATCSVHCLFSKLHYIAGSQHSSSTTESLRQLSSEISGLLAQPTNFDTSETTKEYARKANEDNNKLLEEEIENLRMHLANEKTKFEQKLKEESFKLKDQLEVKTKAIEPSH